MIAQRSTSYNSSEVHQEDATSIILALLSEQPETPSRWDCDICGMIHTGPTPLTCDSCGSELLTQQDVAPIEMNSRW